MANDPKPVDRNITTQGPEAADLTRDADLHGRTGGSDLLKAVPELARYPELAAKIISAFESPARRLDVLFTDMDNTFIPGTGRTPEQLAEGLRATHRLIDFLEPQPFVLIPVTGSGWSTDTRTTSSVSSRIKSGEIPDYHHALVTDGGMIALGKDAKGAFQIDPNYEEELSVLKDRFNPEGVFDLACLAMDQINVDSFAERELGLSPIDFDKIVSLDPSSPRKRIYLQEHIHPDNSVSGSKVCLYFYANSLAERDAIERVFRDEFRDKAIVCCEERDFNNLRDRSAGAEPMPTKFCLDITPVHKGTPVHYYSELIKRAADALHMKRGGEELKICTWYAGDAANDLVAARRPEVDRVIMVGGSNQEFLRHADSLARTGKRVYIEPDAHRLGSASILRAITEDQFV